MFVANTGSLEPKYHFANWSSAMIVGSCQMYVFIPKFSIARLALPAKPNLTQANLTAEDGYFSMGSRFKASRIKRMLWWLAKESQELADQNPTDS